MAAELSDCSCGGIIYGERTHDERTAMNLIRAGISSLAAMLWCSGSALAQDAKETPSINIVVQAFDGRNGKPLQNQHLLVFTGPTRAAVISHASNMELTTDKSGSGTISLDPAEVRWIQVWADGRVPCQPNANQESFGVATIMSKGVATLNNCSAVVHEASPGQFIVFARPKSFSEKMHE
jgi:hypothetical protein